MIFFMFIQIVYNNRIQLFSFTSLNNFITYTFFKIKNAVTYNSKNKK